jgi:glycosyltransferase involved in cell wall biosynthesis
MFSGSPVISLVVPGYNEAANVPHVVAGAIRGFEEHGIHFEIIPVDDGSTDDSWAVLQSLARDERIRPQRHEKNKGLGAALRTGFSACRGEYVSWMPGDGQADIQAVLQSLGMMSSADIVLGMRQVKRDMFRGFITLCFHLMVRTLYSFDAANFCGFYTIRRTLLQSLPLKSENVFLNIEVPIRCASQKARFGRFTLEVKPRLSGASKVANFRTMFKNVIEILRIRFSG